MSQEDAKSCCNIAGCNPMHRKSTETSNWQNYPQPTELSTADRTVHSRQNCPQPTELSTADRTVHSRQNYRQPTELSTAVPATREFYQHKKSTSLMIKMTLNLNCHRCWRRFAINRKGAKNWLWCPGTLCVWRVCNNSWHCYDRGTNGWRYCQRSKKYGWGTWSRARIW
jgi:hypothetical protein